MGDKVIATYDNKVIDNIADSISKYRPAALSKKQKMFHCVSKVTFFFLNYFINWNDIWKLIVNNLLCSLSVIGNAFLN